jgi:hypothetical protein
MRGSQPIMQQPAFHASIVVFGDDDAIEARGRIDVPARPHRSSWRWNMVCCNIGIRPTSHAVIR